MKSAALFRPLTSGRSRPISAVLVLAFVAMHAHEGEAAEQSLEVTATAYNSVEAQTSKQPWLAAWGDTLAPGMKVIAVSRDLLELGLGRGTVVRIDGLEGQFVVLDKMNKRWRRKIDVYMGSDIQAARKFGRRNVTIRWRSTEAPVDATATSTLGTSVDVVAEAEAS